MKAGQTEVVITISDILWSILRRFRMILIVTAIGAAVMGAYGYLQSGDQEEALPSVVDLSGLTEEEKVQIGNAVLLQERYEEMLSEYYSNYIMLMDENQVYRTTLQYYVEIPTESDWSIAGSDYDYATDLLEAYTVYAVGDEVCEAIAEASGGIIRREDLEYLLSATYVNRTLTILVRAADQETSQLMADCVVQAVAVYSRQLNERLGAHTLTLINDFCTVGADESVSNAKTQKKLACENAKTDASDLYLSLTSELQEKVSAILETNEEDKAGNTVSARSVSLRYILTGAVLGFVIAVIIAVCEFIWSRTLNSLAELEQRYGLKLFGKLLLPKGGKHGRDRAIKCGQYHVDGRIPFDDQILYAASRIKLYCTNHRIEEIYLTGSLINRKEEQAWMTNIAKALESLKVRTATAGQTAKSVDVLNGMTSVRNVLLVEQMEKSSRIRFEELLSLCKEQDLNVLGVIVLI